MEDGGAFGVARGEFFKAAGAAGRGDIAEYFFQLAVDGKGGIRIDREGLFVEGLFLIIEIADDGVGDVDIIRVLGGQLNEDIVGEFGIELLDRRCDECDIWNSEGVFPCYDIVDGGQELAVVVMGDYRGECGRGLDAGG
ncbi:hypothetical protein ACQ86N_33910 [Puia sp. P3]|uniref:hypothetical protein n=1 Tax=Puia sp. P3 TaxID=3423952 RepID=UPI003D6689DE